MTLDEVISQLEQCKIRAEALNDYKQVKALRLGIEALKRIKQDRHCLNPLMRFPLPGETKE